MKTFEQEYAELIEWAKEQFDKSMAIPCGEGKDGPQTVALRKSDQEWRRRLRELKKKYGMPME